MIQMNEFCAEPEDLKRNMLQAVERVLNSGWYVLGPEVAEFERRWAQACGVTHGVGVGNGMDAIEIALRALDIGPGDEVITTPMTAFATVLAILRAGATPVLADIEPNTGQMSIVSATRCLSGATKAVLLVHLYGEMRQMQAWTSFCTEHGLQLIEDCAQAHLSSMGGRVAGSWGIAGAYSFYPTKNLGAVGDGGMLVSNDPHLAARASRLRNYGQSARYHHPELGMNSRLDELQAAILSARLKLLPNFTARRREVAGVYRSQLKSEWVELLQAPQEQAAHVYHLFVVLCEQREALQEHLLKQRVQSLIHYPVPIHHQPPCQSVRRDPHGLSVSERFARRCLSLPCHPQMSDADILQVVAAVNSFSGS